MGPAEPPPPAPGGSALVVELGVVLLGVVAALALAVLAAPLALDHHDDPLVRAVPDVRADVLPVPLLGDLLAGLARLVDLLVTDLVLVLGQRWPSGSQPSRAQAGGQAGQELGAVRTHRRDSPVGFTGFELIYRVAV